MPFILSANACKKCGTSNTLFRNRWNKQNQKWYLQSTCKQCERSAFKTYQQENLEYFAEYNRTRYCKLNGGLKRTSPLVMTEEMRIKWRRDKANKRATRAKHARVRWDKEFTDFVCTEAHALRQLRNELFNFEWHVDHMIPLKGEQVCGLHVWNNFAVIPKVDNLRKGNYYSVHEKRKA